MQAQGGSWYFKNIGWKGTRGFQDQRFFQALGCSFHQVSRSSSKCVLRAPSCGPARHRSLLGGRLSHGLLSPLGRAGDLEGALNARSRAMRSRLGRAGMKAEEDPPSLLGMVQRAPPTPPHTPNAVINTVSWPLALASRKSTSSEIDPACG